MSSNPATPEPSEIAGRYQVVKKLGAGAFGTVYKARDTRLERMVAIKTIRLEGLAASQAGVKDMLDRFEREAKTAAKLKHPGIVTIYDYDFGESHGLSYIAMEFIDGVGLDSIISQGGRLPVERAAALGAQVADALDYAHRFQVVHRDIKPANIMIEAGDRVKVTDFGIAKPGDSADHLTQTGSLLGTPSYMSPEQARGQKLDGRSDLFALGCVIYEMVAGRKAFRGDSITALLFKIIAEEPQPLHELDPSLPLPLVRLIQKAIAKSPDLRFQTGREMADELLTLTRAGAMPTLRAVDTPTLPPPHESPTIASAPTLAGTPTAVSPGTLPPPANPTLPASAPPPLAPTILTPGTATAAGAPAAPARPAPARPAQASARAAKSGSGLGLVLGLAAVGVVLLVAVAGGGWWFLRHRQPAEPVVAPTPVAESALPTPVAPPTTAPAVSMPAEIGPTPAATAAAATPVPAATVAPRGTTTSQPGAGHRVAAATEPPQPGAAASHAGTPPQQPAGGDFGFLNDVPQQGPDGREVGEALANAYRSGGSSGITNRRFNARPRVPRDVAPAERPAVATLLHIMFIEQAYQRQNGRYGTLRDLKAAGLLHLDVPFANGQFERRQYRFELTGEGGEYKVTATPLAIGSRPFLADDSGFVRVDE